MKIFVYYDIISLFKKEEKMNAVEYSKLLIHFANKRKMKFSNLHLQKALYYLIALESLEQGKYAIKEEFQAWDYGPVLYTSWKKYNLYSAMTIPSVEIVNEYEVNEICVKNIMKVLDYFAINSIWDIVDETHNDLIWKENFGKNDNNIPKKDYYNFFNKYGVKL